MSCRNVSDCSRYTSTCCCTAAGINSNVFRILTSRSEPVPPSASRACTSSCSASQNSLGLAPSQLPLTGPDASGKRCIFKAGAGTSLPAEAAAPGPGTETSGIGQVCVERTSSSALSEGGDGTLPGADAGGAAGVTCLKRQPHSHL